MNGTLYLRLITIKYLGPTNTRGSRIKVTDERNHQSRVLTLDNRYSAETNAAQFLESLGIKVLFECEVGTKIGYLTDNFVRSIKGGLL